MAYTTRHLEDSPVAVVAIDGKLDESYVPLVRQQISVGRPWVLVNLAASLHIRGDHMEWMVETHHACEQAGGAYALTDVPADFAYILSIMQLDQFFRIFPTEEAGVQTFAQTSITALESTESASDLLEIALPAPGKRLNRRERAKQEAQEREQRVQLFVKHVAPGMTYLRVFETLAKTCKAGAGPRRVDTAVLASESKQSKSDVSRVLKHLVELRICSRGDGGIHYDPGPAAESDIDDFLKMWRHATQRTKLRKLVFAEEKSREAPGGLTGLMRRLLLRSDR